jgi:hypothetical protein
MKKKDSFKYFKECVSRWVNYFGLHNWDVNVHMDDDGYDGILAETLSRVENKRADIYLVMEWDGTEMTKYSLNETAFHEVLEVMLAEIRYIAGRRDIRFGEIDSAIHNIIRILTAKIFRNGE